MKKTEFIAKINEGISRGKNFMVVKISTEDEPTIEVIINVSEISDKKLKQYLGAYTDDLELIIAKQSGKIIKITDVLMTSNLNDLSWFVY